MNYQVTPLIVDYSANKSKQFYFTFKDAIVHHTTEPLSIEVLHNSKKVVAGIQNEIQSLGNPDLIYSSETADMNYDVEIEDEIFLLYDQAGLNYIHFFFNLFCKCLYYDALQNKKIKIGMTESFYQDSGSCSFVKEWLSLYYDDIEFFVFKKGIKYKIKTLQIPNGYYAFPDGIGNDLILQIINRTANKVPKIHTDKKGVYISRQDTIKRGWYHNRILINELELIERLRSDLDYDIVELMDFDIIKKIQIFKSYDYILQQSSASNINVIFSNPNNTNIILTHPKMEDWLGSHTVKFASVSETNLILLSNGGILRPELKDPTVQDPNNVPWELENIDGIIDTLKML